MGFERYQGSSSLAVVRGPAVVPDGRSSREALCIGIDQYPNPEDRLGGCVNDANSWAREFQRRGFRVESLTDAAATRSAILDAIESKVSRSRSGDVIAIQMSCHGTQLTDYSRDESDGRDEAVVPYDHRTRGYLIDDDIGEICNQIPHGVSVSFFLDLCHSGTATRFLIGSFGGTGADVRERFLKADSEMEETHARTANRSRAAHRNAYRDRPETLFSACAADQTAKERNGQGDFTRSALRVLGQPGSGLTNAEFIDQVRRSGSFQDQDPELWCDSSLRDKPILSSCGGDSLRNDGATGTDDIDARRQALREIRQGLDRLENLL